jgi:hypothetical protein
MRAVPLLLGSITGRHGELCYVLTEPRLIDVPSVAHLERPCPDDASPIESPLRWIPTSSWPSLVSWCAVPVTKRSGPWSTSCCCTAFGFRAPKWTSRPTKWRAANRRDAGWQLTFPTCRLSRRKQR